MQASWPAFAWSAGKANFYIITSSLASSMRPPMADQPIASVAVKEPSYLDAAIPLITLVVLIAGSVFLFGRDAVEGPMQVALILSCMVASFVILKNGHSWDDIVKAGQSALSSITSPIFILLAVGALIGTWNMSGTIPTLAVYGIRLLRPDYLYVATAVICGIISMGTGSSWTTAGTIGVGLVGIATLAGVSPAITAGAVISGAYLGDKLSPLSETTVLAAQLAQVDVRTHIRAAIWTAGPAFVVAVIVFTILGLPARGESSAVHTATELAKLDQLFWITPLNLIPLVVLIGLSVRKAPASLSIMSSALLAALLGAILQPKVVSAFVNDPSLSAPLVSIKGAWLAMASGYRASSGIPEVDSLLSRGGMSSMLKTLWIIIGAVTFGTLLEEFNLLSKLVTPTLTRAKTTGSLIATVVATAIGLNIVAADQYIALVLPARLFRAEFRKRELKPQNLSRTCADAGTVTSPLVPWNSCGAYMSAALGVSTIQYLPFCVFNIAAPLISLLWGLTGFKIEYLEPARAGRGERPAA
jgi:Na+:H+ antiporter, NhaC family